MSNGVFFPHPLRGYDGVDKRSLFALAFSVSLLSINKPTNIDDAKTEVTNGLKLADYLLKELDNEG